MERIISSIKAPITYLPPFSSSSSSSSIKRRTTQLGFPVSPRSSHVFKPLIRVSLENSEGAATKETESRYAEELFGMESFSIMALSKLDGRYVQKVKELHPFFSEYGLIRYRVMVEVKWLLKLSEVSELKEVPSFSKNDQIYLESVIGDFNIDDALEVKKIEKVTNHDVKAVEYFLKQKCKSNAEIAKPASPTALGKEMANFSFRLNEVGKIFTDVQILGKCACAVGNYNAHMVAYPNINWPNIAEEFVNSLGIDFNPFVTQTCLRKASTRKTRARI